ncbi:hypothetical protein C6P45_004692 [Maudiozyma exigua]|uniref:Uncharacterized protein n=1 Tax=Maudiozyma exigua TaxID=34358 RepID=A0A9P6W9Z4_MAUEX|nr:hypothetical protein C6P45_004692 [Kazachstania exigua]
MTEIINKQESKDSFYNDSTTIDQQTLIDDNNNLSEIPRNIHEPTKRRKSSIASVSKDMIQHLRRLNPSNYHNNINTNDISNETNTFDRYNKFYEEKSNKKYHKMPPQSNYTTTTTSSTTSASTVDNWTHTINDYWLKDTKIEDIEFDDSSDEGEQ